MGADARSAGGGTGSGARAVGGEGGPAVDAGFAGGRAIARATRGAAGARALARAALPADEIAPVAEEARSRPSVTARRVARAAARPAAADATGRHLSLVSPEPGPARVSRATEIAERTGGTIESEPGGMQTVHFPAPPISQAPVTVSRATTVNEMTVPVSQPAASPSGGQEALSPDAMYEYFIERFKRDLLIEREQLGHLIIDNP
jgi:hypothetical protein